MSLPENILNYFAAMIKRELGIIYGPHNYYQLEVRLIEISKQLGLSGPEALLAAANAGKIPGNGRALLLDMATNNETSFFRDAHVFQAVLTLMRTHFDKAKAVGGAVLPFRIWSAACSTGQEVYSLAIARQEAGFGAERPFAVLATDTSERVLARAAAGQFSDLEMQRGLSPEQLTRHFDHNPDAASKGVLPYTIKRELRAAIEFRRLNLIETWDSNRIGIFDLILCRNMLIYQTIESRRDIVQRLAKQLKPGGVLILGGSESMIGVSDDFVDERIGKAVIFRLKAGKLQAVG